MPAASSAVPLPQRPPGADLDRAWSRCGCGSRRYLSPAEVGPRLTFRYVCHAGADGEPQSPASRETTHHRRIAGAHGRQKKHGQRETARGGRRRLRSSGRKALAPSTWPRPKRRHTRRRASRIRHPEMPALPSGFPKVADQRSGRALVTKGQDHQATRTRSYRPLSGAERELSSPVKPKAEVFDPASRREINAGIGRG